MGFGEIGSSQVFFHNPIFCSCKGEEIRAARSSLGNAMIHIFNICMLIYINLYAPFKRCWLQLCKIKHATALDHHTFQACLPVCCPVISPASPSLFHEVSFIYSYPRIITINEKSYHLVVKLELVLKYSFFVIWAHIGILFFSQGFHNTFPLPVARKHRSLVHMRHHNLGSRNHLWVQLTAFRPTVKVFGSEEESFNSGQINHRFQLSTPNAAFHWPL